MTEPVLPLREPSQPVPVHTDPDGSVVLDAAGIPMPDPLDPALANGRSSATHHAELLIAALGRLADGTFPRGDIRGVQYSAPTETRRVIPDLDDELVDALAQIEELLLRLAAWEEDNADPHAHGDWAGPTLLPAPLAGQVALDALNRVQDAVVPTQTRTGHAGREIPPTDPAAHTRLYGPDGHHEHRPLRVVTVARSDLDTLAAAARELGHALATRPGSELAEALHDGARATLPHHPRDVTAAALVETLARAHGLLDLADSDDHADDTDALRRRLVAAAGADVVLTAAEETAYQRLAERANTMWTARAPLARWLD